MNDNNDTIDGETAKKAIENTIRVVEGDMEPDTEEFDRLTEPGLSEEQREVAQDYMGEGWVKVDEIHNPTFAEKLASGKKIPTTFLLDGVQFAQKTHLGAGNNPSKWDWYDGGFHFTLKKWNRDSDRIAEVCVSEDNREPEYNSKPKYQNRS